MIQGGSFVYKTKEKEIEVQVIGGLPPDKEEIIGETRSRGYDYYNIGFDISTYANRIYDGSSQLMIKLDGNMDNAVICTNVYDIQDEIKKTTYSNKPASILNPGQSTIDYDVSESIYTGNKREMSESVRKKADSIKMYMDIDSFDGYGEIQVSTGYSFQGYVDLPSENKLPIYLYVPDYEEKEQPLPYEIVVRLYINSKYYSIDECFTLYGEAWFKQ